MGLQEEGASKNGSSRSQGRGLGVGKETEQVGAKGTEGQGMLWGQKGVNRGKSHDNLEELEVEDAHSGECSADLLPIMSMRHDNQVRTTLIQTPLQSQKGGYWCKHLLYAHDSPDLSATRSSTAMHSVWLQKHQRCCKVSPKFQF